MTVYDAPAARAERDKLRAQIQKDHPGFKIWTYLPYATRSKGAGGTIIMAKDLNDLAEQLATEDK